MLGMIVHNQYVVDACEKLGIHFVEEPGRTRLELLDRIDSGIVILLPMAFLIKSKESKAKGLTIVDASCPDVIKTHDLVKSACAHGGDVLYIGKKGHPESEGTVGLSDRVHLITSCADIEPIK
jgi:4-hydroxy-3-methylbut-2-enyl diphosphate reductase